MLSNCANILNARSLCSLSLSVSVSFFRKCHTRRARMYIHAHQAFTNGQCHIRGIQQSGSDYFAVHPQRQAPGCRQQRQQCHEQHEWERQSGHVYRQQQHGRTANAGADGESANEPARSAAPAGAQWLFHGAGRQRREQWHASSPRHASGQHGLLRQREHGAWQQQQRKRKRAGSIFSRRRHAKQPWHESWQRPPERIQYGTDANARKHGSARVHNIIWRQWPAQHVLRIRSSLLRSGNVRTFRIVHRLGEHGRLRRQPRSQLAHQQRQPSERSIRSR
mmetsp:Transcript_22865/g.63746  ORF Transcript_22865/g.63746 Transcript_22865/m.63746 type:complete len:278 (+) Transcript_22865:40-873(+)